MQYDENGNCWEITTVQDLMDLEKKGWEILKNEKYKDGVVKLHIRNIIKLMPEMGMIFCSTEILNKYYLTDPVNKNKQVQNERLWK